MPENSDEPKTSDLEAAFASSAEAAHQGQVALIELRPAPHIFDYSPSALRTMHYLTEDPDLNQLSEASLEGLVAELERARLTLRATAEFQGQADAAKHLAEAGKLVDKTFASASATEQAFVEDWVELMKLGEAEASTGARVFAVVRATEDLARHAQDALRTGRVVKLDVGLAAVRVLTDRVTRAEARAGAFFDRREKLCAELETTDGLDGLVETASEFCEADRPRPNPGAGQATPPGSSAAEPPPSPAKSQPALTASSPLSTEGLGPVLVGMNVAKEERSGARPNSKMERQRVRAARYFEARGLGGVSFMVTNGAIARIDVFEAGVRTLSGIGVGDPESSITEAYGDQVPLARTRTTTRRPNIRSLPMMLLTKLEWSLRLLTAR